MVRQPRPQTGGTVVCAVDADERDATVARMARLLADRLDARLELIHVGSATHVVGTEPWPMLPPGGQAVRHDTVALRRTLGELARRIGRPDAACEVVVGPRHPVLVELTRRQDVRWIVTRDHGRGALRAAIAGDPARALVAESRCPVVAVPAHADPVALEAPGAIVCAVEAEPSAPRTAATAGQLAGSLGARLAVVHAVDRRRLGSADVADVEDLLDRCLAGVPRGVSAKGVAVLGPPLEAIAEVAEDEGATIVVTGCPSHGPLRSAIGGSVLHAMLARLDEHVVVAVPRVDSSADGEAE